MQTNLLVKIMYMITNPNYIIPQNFLAHLRNCRIIYGIIPDMSKSPVTISLLLDCIGGSGRLQLSGIFRYIHEHALNWTTVVDPFNSSSIPAAGYIVDGKHAGEFARIASARVPIVALGVERRLLPKSAASISTVKIDNREIARLAAAHIRELGRFKSYVYVHDPDRSEWSVLRERNFRKLVAGTGVKYAALPHPAKGSFHQLLDTLSGQSGPVFVFCANDRCASNVLSACKSAGVRVPAEVAVIGVDNDTLLCNHSDPTLTSIEPDFEREGYEAAKELDRLLSGPGKPPHRIPLVSGSSVVVRASTRPVYSAEAIVQAGMDFIRGNFAKGITVTSVVRAMRVSRRLAELRFRQVRGTTIGASIAEARIRHAQKLLKTTQMSLDEIAADCGISGANYLARVFRRHVGLSPRAWARARG